MNIIGASGELPDRSEGSVAACGERDHPHYTVVGNGVNHALLDGKHTWTPAEETLSKVLKVLPAFSPLIIKCGRTEISGRWNC